MVSPLSQDAPRPGGGPGPEDATLTLRTLSGFTWAFLTSGGQALLSLAIMMTLSRLLTPQDFGMVALALVFIALAETAGRSGLGPALVQRADLTASHIAAALTLAVAGAVPLTATLWILAPLLCRLVGAPAAAPVLRILSWSVALSGAGLVSEHLLHRRLRFRALMTAALLSQAVGNGLVAIVLALMDWGVEALVWGVVARQAVFSAAVILLAPVPPRLFAGRRAIADLLRTGAGFSAIAVFSFLATRGLTLVIARTLGAAALGLYTRAHALAVVSARLGPVMAKVLLPSMARRQHRVERLRAVHRGGIEMLSLAVVPASLMIAMTAPEIIAVVLGRQWEGAVPALRILALAGVLQAFSALHVPVIRSLGAVYRETWRRALFFVLLMAGVWLASRWGLAAIAAAAVAAGVVLQGLLAHLALDLLGTRWTRLLRCLVPAVWTGLWSTAALWIAAAGVRRAALPPLVALALELAVWGATAGAATWCAPPFARPVSPHWALAQLPFSDMGWAGPRLRALFAHLTRRWPAPPPGEAAADRQTEAARPQAGASSRRGP